MAKSMRVAVCSIVIVAASLFSVPASALQCAPFARDYSGIQLFGDAAGWWNQADGKYERGHAPKLGSVLVFKATGAMRVGHVATVSRIVGDREIRVTHANWSVIAGHRGQIERDVAVLDTSAAGDWSEVKVWYAPIGKVGTHAYPVYGFVYGGKSGGAAPVRMASADPGPAVAPDAQVIPGLLAAAGTHTFLP